MKKYFILYFSSLITHYSSIAHDIFVSKGIIEFEKKVNIYKNLDDQSSNDDEGSFDWIRQLKKQMPEYNITYFNLFFDGNRTLYKPGRESIQTQKIPDWFSGPAQDNVVFCDLQSDKSTTQKT